MFEFRHTEAYAHQPFLCLWQRGRNGSGKPAERASAGAVLSIFLSLIFLAMNVSVLGQKESTIYKKDVIKGGISPKSVVSSGTGVFAAQNMMYRHSVTLYDESGRLIAKIKDNVNLEDFGFEGYKSKNYLGGPVEAVFSGRGRYLWVSQYSMIGKEFKNPGCDACTGKSYDPSFVYKINTITREVENVIEVGAVPKFMAITADESKILVTNWSSSDVSIIDVNEEKEIRRIEVGSHPRGIAIKSDGSEAFVTIMGSTKIARINLSNFETTYITDVGKAPRHLALSSDDKTLYCSVNSSNKVVKINLEDNGRQVCYTNSGPRSMVLSDDQRFLYVVNYFSNTFTKIQTDSMIVKEVVKTSKHPIGICGNWDTGEIWVACYSGSIEIFRDFELKAAEDDHLLALNGGLKEWLNLTNTKSVSNLESEDNINLSKDINEERVSIHSVDSKRSEAKNNVADSQIESRQNSAHLSSLNYGLFEKRKLKKAKVIDVYKQEEEAMKSYAEIERKAAMEKSEFERNQNDENYLPETRANYAPIKKIDFLALKQESDRNRELLALEESKKELEKINIEEDSDLAGEQILENAEIIPELTEEKPTKTEATKVAVNSSGPRTLASANKASVGMVSKSSHVKQVDKFNPEGCKFHVIVGSFAEKANAEKLLTDMKTKGYPAQIIVGNSLTYVSAQCYTTSANASHGMKDIQEEVGISGWVLER